MALEVLKRKKYCYPATLHSLLSQSSVEFVTYIHKAIDFYIDQYESMVNGGTDPESRAHSFQEFVDSTYLEDYAKNLFNAKSCKKGCNFCCSNPVIITKDELALIWTTINHSNLVIDGVRIKNQIGMGHKWFSLSKENRQCVFLSAEGLCSIYKYRPLSCRKYYVASDPSNCELKDGPNPVSVLVNRMAEVAASAAMTTVGGGFMADLLDLKMKE